MCLKKLCRTCLSSTELVFPLFDTELMGFCNAAEILEKVTSVPLYNEDNMPDHICVICFCEIKRAYSFKMKCEKSQIVLSQLKEVKINLKKLKDIPDQHEFGSENKCITLKEEPEEILDLYDYDYDDIIVQDNAITSELELNRKSPISDFVKVELDLENFKTEPELNIQDIQDIECCDNECKADKQLKCRTCGKQYESLDLFCRHIVSDHIEEKLCKLCNEEFDCSAIGHSVNHLPSGFLNKSTHGKELEAGEDLEKQIENVQNTGKFCQQCSRHFTNSKVFRLHVCSEILAIQNDMDVEMENKKHTKHPSKCENIRPGQSSDSHMKAKHKKKLSQPQAKIPCSVCSKLISKAGLKEHMRIHTGETPFQCKLCSKKFGIRKLLSFHMEMKHINELPDRKPRFQCSVCSKISGCQADLNRHMRIHTGEKPFSCDVCSEKFRHRNTLVVHISAKHSNTLPDSKPKHQCEVCSHIFAHQFGLVKHMRTHKRNKLLQCEICFVKYRNSKALITHMETKHSNDSPSDAPKYQCSYCSEMFKHNSDLIIHVRSHTSEKLFECKLCLEKFRHNRSLMIHMGVKHSKKLPPVKPNFRTLFQCGFCSVKYGRGQSLIAHMETKHSNDLYSDDSKYQCGFCSEMFKRNIDLIRHVCSPTDKKPFQCELCLEKFRHNQSLTIHMETKHPNNLNALDLNYECSICSKIFNDYNDLMSHMRSHKDDKLFECEFCSAKYRNSVTLITHMETKHSHDLRSDESKNQCSFCSKTFKYSRNLVNHMRLHTYDKLFQCELCSEQFGNNQTLVIHMEIKHSNDLPADGPKYQCSDCSKIFHYNCDLIGHMRIHTNSFSFKCKFCTEQFRLEQSLVVHMESKHPTKLSAVEPNYQCIICSKVFENVLELVSHMPSHTDEKLQCELCSE